MICDARATFFSTFLFYMARVAFEQDATSRVKYKHADHLRSSISYILNIDHENDQRTLNQVDPPKRSLKDAMLESKSAQRVRQRLQTDYSLKPFTPILEHIPAVESLLPTPRFLMNNIKHRDFSIHKSVPSASVIQRLHSHTPKQALSQLKEGNFCQPTKELENLLHRAHNVINPDFSHIFKTQNGNQSCQNRQFFVRCICEVSSELQYSYDATYIAINLFDRVLSLYCIPSLKHAQIIMLGCLFVTGKFCHGEEANQPVIHQFIRFSTSMGPHQLIEAEEHILNLLSWQVNLVTPQSIIREILHIFPGNIRKASKIINAVQNYMNVACLEWGYMTYTADLLAFACLKCVLEESEESDLRGFIQSLLMKVKIDKLNLLRCVRFMREKMSSSRKEVKMNK